MNKTVIHAAAGTLALCCIATFWTSTLIAELCLTPTAVCVVKQAIATIGIPLLVVAMAITGATGASLGKGRNGRLLEQKKQRMPFIAGNGVLIMIPSAFFLYAKAAAGQFDLWFTVVQCLELLVGLLQLTLMGKNFVAGWRLAGKLRPKPTVQH